jgi:subtilisin family serine protease
LAPQRRRLTPKALAQSAFGSLLTETTFHVTALAHSRFAARGAFVLAAAVGAAVISPAAAFAAPAEDVYLITVDGTAKNYKDDVTDAGGSVDKVFTNADVIGATLTAAEAAELAKDPNLTVEIDGSGGPADVQPTSPSYYGLDRTDQRDLPLSGSYNYEGSHQGAGVTVYIMDSGIRADHSQFSGRVAPGFSVATQGTGTEDCAGHGTHVAGTVGGVDSGIAKQVTLVPVRLFGCTSAGYNGYEFLSAMEWVVANHQPGVPAVLNLSISGGGYAASDAAVQAVINDGVTVVAAAGNDSHDACLNSPARAPGAITVAASNINDSQTSYSNFGSCVDLFAPGGDANGYVYSANWQVPAGEGSIVGNAGTSMATPHVVGAAARYLSAHPTATPADVAAALLNSATTNKISNVSAGTPNRLLYVSPDTAVTAPLAPVAIAATATGNPGEIFVNWTPSGDNGGADVTNYTVTMSATATAPAQSQSVGVNTAAVFTGLDRSARTFSVVATSGLGTSAASPSTALVVANAVTAPGAPQGIALKALVNKVRVSWTAPPSSTLSPIGTYLINLRSSTGKSTIVEVSGADTSWTSPKVKAGVKYVATMVTKNGVGTSPAVQTKTVTGASKATAPRSVKATSTKKLRTKVSWTKPKATGHSKVVRYEVRYTKKAGKKSWSVWKSSSKKTSYTIKGLKKGVKRYVQIRVVTKAGDGKITTKAIRPTR